MRRQFIISWENPRFDSFFTEKRIEQALNSKLRVDGHDTHRIMVSVQACFLGADDILVLTDSEIVKQFRRHNFKDEEGIPLPIIVRKLCDEYGKTYTKFSDRQRLILNQIFYTHELKIINKEKNNDSSNDEERK